MSLSMSLYAMIYIHYGNREEREVFYNDVYRVLKKEGLFSVNISEE